MRKLLHIRKDLLASLVLFLFEIHHHQYNLQYLLYCVAVKKILAVRQPHVAFEDLFGGVVYLFLRGMTGGPETGVYFDPVPIDLIQALDASLSP